MGNDGSNRGQYLRLRAGVLLLAAVATAAACEPRQAPQSEQVASTPPSEDPLAAADALVDSWVQEERIPGAVLLVSRRGRAVFEKAYGWAQLYEYNDGQYGASAAGEARPSAIRRLSDPRPMTTDTIFDLASVTKVMATTFAVMLLVDAGDLDLDAPVRTYLPEFAPGDPSAHAGTADTGTQSISISLRHLLTHRSGLPQWKPVYYHAADADQAYAYIRGLSPTWEVGSERHYSDLGFMLLGLVVERIAGMPLDAFLDERLYGPLGLTSTGFLRDGSAGGGELGAGGGGDGTAAMTGARGEGTRTPASMRLAGPYAATSHGNPYEHRMVHDAGFGYRIEGDADAWNGWRRYTLVGEVNDGNAFHAFGGVAGHAGLFSTAADLQVLLQVLLNGGEYGGHRYLSADVIDTFLTETGDGQALGWQVPDGAPRGSFAHPGFTGTYVLGVPARGLAVVLLTNRQNLGVDDGGQYPDVGELQRQVASAVLR